MNERTLGARLFLGRTPSGERVYVTVRVRVVPASGHSTVDHQPIGACEELSIRGDVYAAGTSGFSDRDWVMGGQCDATAALVLADAGTLARGADRSDVALIVESWQRWHLNGMHAGCVHVEPVGETTEERLRLTPPCPVSGYRYGSAWLVEPLPDGLVADLEAACARLAR